MPIWPLQRDAIAFYGNPYSKNFERDNIVSVQCPWVIRGSQKSQIRINRKCAASLTKILNATWQAVGKSQAHIQELRYDIFSGSFVVRNMRGGSSLSMHALGAAVDWDAADNAQHSQRHLFTHNSPLIIAAIAEGWIWGGDWTPGSIDAMHIQAARVHS